MPLILGANSVTGGYEIDNSLRFNTGSSDYLAKNSWATATSDKIFTYSTWVKRSQLANTERLFGAFAGSPQVYSCDLSFTSNNGYIEFTFGGASAYDIVTNAMYRDTSAWYHVVLAVDTTQATASNRIIIYVNGTVQTLQTANYPPQNTTYQVFRNNNANLIGSAWNGGAYYSGYMSEVVFIDGQQLAPSDFGEFDSATGIWTPIAYTGTYGTNGFYLEFKDSSALGDDTSGNGNDFTVNNLTSIDQTTDTPTNNFATLNAVDNIAVDGSGTLTQGNTNVSYIGGGFNTNATIAPNSGKWYWETKAVANTTQGFVGMRIGFKEIPDTHSATNTLENASFCMYAHPTVGVYTVVNASNVLRDAALTYADGDIIGIALDLDSNISYWYKNGSLSVTYDFSALSSIGSKNIGPAVGNGASSASPELNLNFGNPSITISSGNADADGFGNFEYAVPSGHFALCSKNLAEYG
jgi:hypothetical protein